MTSIRAFLIVLILAVICLANFSAALQGYRDSRQVADQKLNQDILDKISILIALIDADGTIPPSMFPENTLFQVFRGGTLLAYSVNAPRQPLIPQDNRFHMASHDGQQWRAFGNNIHADELHVIVAQHVGELTALTEDLLIRAIAPIIWVLPGLAILVWAVIAFGLRPLRRLATDVAEKKAHDFSAIENPSSTREIAPIVDAINALLGRLKAAFDREKRFSADAAHELRTPLAAIKVDLHNLASAVSAPRELNSLRRTVDRMEHCIEQLLALHRVSIEQQTTGHCDLVQEARDILAQGYPAFSRKHQNIALNGERALIAVDAFAADLLLRNLINNAHKYTPEGGTIEVSITQQDENVMLSVEDSGPGVDPQEYDNVLQRFYRIGGDQHQSGQSGVGLGMSIVVSVVDQFGGSLQLEPSKKLGGLSVLVRFPAWRAT